MKYMNNKASMREHSMMVNLLMLNSAVETRMILKFVLRIKYVRFYRLLHKFLKLLLHELCRT